MLVGLTGNFGTGKSTVLDIFAKLGALTIDSDEIVRKLYTREDIKAKVITILGNDVIDDTGQLNKKEIANIIFNNNSLKRKLEVLLHNFVFKNIEEISGNNPGRLLIAEIPLLYETAYNEKVDHVILLYCRRDIIFDRLRKSGLSDVEIKARLSSQMPDTVKRHKADTVIDTGRHIDEIEKDVRAIFKNLSN